MNREQAIVAARGIRECLIDVTVKRMLTVNAGVYALEVLDMSTGTSVEFYTLDEVDAFISACLLDREYGGR